MAKFKQAEDGRGAYEVDWSMLERCADEPPRTVEFVPFAAGGERIMSIPADETMCTGVGRGDTLTHAVIALRVGDRAAHQALTAAGMRQLAAALLATATMIDGGGGLD